MLASLLAVGVVSALRSPAGGAAGGGSPPTVAVFGDSLILQAMPYLTSDLSSAVQANVINNTYSGTEPCSWMPQMLTEAQSGSLAAAVISFSGDDFGCMSPYPLGTPAYYEAYQHDVTEAADAFSAAGVHTFIVGYPLNLPDVESGDPNWDELNDVYATVAQSVPNTTFVNAGAAVEDNGMFAWTLPCLFFEPYCGPAGQNTVREMDGGHFYPLDPTNAGVVSPDYASGAVRFAAAIAAPITQYLQKGSEPAYEGASLSPPDVPAAMAPGQVDPYLGVHDLLDAGYSLGVGKSLQSLDGHYSAVLQPDGNLVVSGPRGVLWSSGTAGTGASTLTLTADGDLVLSGASGQEWSSGTTVLSSPPQNTSLALADNGSLGIYGLQGEVWSTPAAGAISFSAATSSEARRTGTSPGPNRRPRNT